MNIAINGFGRIGRTFFRAAFEAKLNIVAINDLGEIKTLGHLLQHDSTYGDFGGEVEIDDGHLTVNGKMIKFISEPEPAKLPWKELNIDVVIESTGVFTDKAKASQHLASGAKYVIITAPVKTPTQESGSRTEGIGNDNKVKTIVMGVNEEQFDPTSDQIISMASCTTNALTPIAKVLNDKFGIQKALMSTIHSFTMDQVLQDSPHKDLRRARAALQSIIPTTTGATSATAAVIPDLQNKINGVSFRVPTATVSLIDFVALLNKDVTESEVNQAMTEASETPKMHGAIAVTNEPLVSADFRGNPNASIVDLLSTQVVGGNLVKVLAWYDNEMGYSYRLTEFCRYVESKIKN